MKNRILYILWASLFILCAGLGFIPEPSGAGQVLLTILSLLFFLPPAILVRQGKRHPENTSAMLLVRNLSILSLSLTLLTLILNFLTAFRSQALGNFLHGVLVIVSSPMVCSGHWAMCLFLWACLLVSCLKKK